MKKQRTKKELREEGQFLKLAIKEKCLDCMAGQKISCEMPDCSLYSFNPYKTKPK